MEKKVYDYMFLASRSIFEFYETGVIKNCGKTLIIIHSYACLIKQKRSICAPQVVLSDRK